MEPRVFVKARDRESRLPWEVPTLRRRRRALCKDTLLGTGLGLTHANFMQLDCSVQACVIDQAHFVHEAAPPGPTTNALIGRNRHRA